MDGKPPVTLVTQNATADTMSLQDYADMFAEMRGRTTIGKMVKAYGDPNWDDKTTENYRQYFFRYEKGELSPNRGMRNILRRAMGIDTLPPTIQEAIGIAYPDASVWRVGDDTPGTIIMVDDEPVTLHVNGAVTVIPEKVVTESTKPIRASNTVTVSRATKVQNERRKALNASWNDVREAGLRTLEALDL